MPSRTVTTSASRPAPHHGPSMSCWFRASGPITAVLRDGSKGRTPPSFWSRTIERLAAFRAAATRVGLEHLRLGLRRQERRVRVLEEAGAELDAQDPAHRVVDPLHADPALREQLLAVVADERARHLGVDAGVQRQSCGGRAVLGDAVTALAGVGILRRAGAQLGDRGPVALDEAVEVPLALEDLVHQVVVRRSPARR